MNSSDLPVGAVRATPVRALIPRQSCPLQVLDDTLFGILNQTALCRQVRKGPVDGLRRLQGCVPGWTPGRYLYLVCVFYPEDEGAALGSTRRQVVEEGGPERSQVQIARGRRGKACPYREIRALAKNVAGRGMAERLLEGASFPPQGP